MRQRLLKWLVCPICYNKLNLFVASRDSTKVSDLDLQICQAISPIDKLEEIEMDISVGALTCQRCKVYYPIYNGIPRMLTYEDRIGQIHAEENKEWIEGHLKGFSLPNRTIPQGEKMILKSFSTEWLGYKWTGESYWGMKLDDRLKCIQYELATDRYSLKHSLLLEVGIGVGAGADALTRSEYCEVVGMDLGYSVDQARCYFGSNPRLHIVQASLFSLPFQPATFDLVYSHGVLHHTYSAQEAFKKIAKLPKRNNGILYIWIYSHDAKRKNVVREILMFIENITRPIISRSPAFIQNMFLAPIALLYILNQNFFRRLQPGKEFTAKYRFNEALHAARDCFTPLFAERQTYSEVINWFKDAGYGPIELLRDEPLPNGVPTWYVINIGVRGIRK